MGMATYSCRSREELRVECVKLIARYEDLCEENLNLDMSRGKPSKRQLDLVSDLLTIVTDPADCIINGNDCRNYGDLAGLKCAREYWADVLGCKPEQTFVGGNASLSLMYDLIARAYSFGLKDSPRPWCKEERIKFLCPSPGYDRHFRITELYGFEMIVIPMTPDGPDMNMVEELVQDPAVKGIWCVPKYSNPQGISYSDETVRRFAGLKPAAKDFRIFWDNAYCVHHIYTDKKDDILNILEECVKAGNPDMVYQFASTSKVTFPGSGIAALSASEANLADVKKHMTLQTIGHDKINQLRHVKFLKDAAGIEAHMQKQADVIRPKFEAVLNVLETELGGLGIAQWTNPNGGYFISFETLEGCAKEVVGKCKEAGVVMTGAGATFPYGKDPKDSNIRIAPTLPTPEELAKAADLFVLCVKLVSVKKLLETK